MKIAIAGAGVMGSGIALSSLLAGHHTVLFDVNEQAVSKGALYIDKELEKSVEKGRISEKRVVCLFGEHQ